MKLAARATCTCVGRLITASYNTKRRTDSGIAHEARQSEMTDPRLLRRTNDIVVHVFITHI